MTGFRGRKPARDVEYSERATNHLTKVNTLREHTNWHATTSPSTSGIACLYYDAYYVRAFTNIKQDATF